jgi:hypothetical protein
MSSAKLQAQQGKVMEEDEMEQQRIEDLLMLHISRPQACYTHPANNDILQPIILNKIPRSTR